MPVVWGAQAIVKRELVDWRTALDASPICENPHGCDREAVERICWGCRCVSLACRSCSDQTVSRLVQAMMLGWTEFDCDACSHRITARWLSNLLRIVPF